MFPVPKIRTSHFAASTGTFSAGIKDENKDNQATTCMMEINESTEDFVYGSILSAFIDDFIFEECIDFMWRIRTDGCPLDEIYNLEPIEGYFAQEKMTGNSTQPSFGGTSVVCPICTELVSGRRFAPHLERCMNGGKRGSKRHYDYLHDEAALKPLPKPKSTETLDHTDHHPNSLIIRIKMRNGAPRANQKRIGATIEDFSSGEVGPTHAQQLV